MSLLGDRFDLTYEELKPRTIDPELSGFCPCFDLTYEELKPVFKSSTARNRGWL